MLGAQCPRLLPVKVKPWFSIFRFIFISGSQYFFTKTCLSSASKGQRMCASCPYVHRRCFHICVLEKWPWIVCSSAIELWEMFKKIDFSLPFHSMGLLNLIYIFMSLYVPEVYILQFCIHCSTTGISESRSATIWWISIPGTTTGLSYYSRNLALLGECRVCYAHNVERLTWLPWSSSYCVFSVFVWQVSRTCPGHSYRAITEAGSLERYIHCYVWGIGQDSRIH